MVKIYYLCGANSYNLLNISLLDFLNKGSPLLSSVSTGQLLTAGLSLIPLLIASIGIFLSIRLPQLSFMNISLYSILILIGYLVAIRTIFRFERNQQQIMRELKKEEEILLKYNDIPLKKACILYGVFAIMIAGAGIWLAYIGEELAQILSLGQNFVGSLFLGFATTLPEITVSVAALRIGAKELAVANMLGSNLFNTSIIFINDALYRKAPIFNFLSQQHIFTGFIIVLMTVIVCVGLILKPKKKTKLGLSNYAIALIVVFILGTYLNFILVRK
ncbi:MAG: hypothetical protein WAW67_02345 [Candidatus Omnitrophota bacterium]